MRSGSYRKSRPYRLLLVASLVLFPLLELFAQTTGSGPGFGSVSTPRPINPATETTNPSATATQSLNPYLGSTPDGRPSGVELHLSLADAVGRGLRFNLGLIDSQQADAGAHAERQQALAALLPQIEARAQQSYQQLSYQQLNIKLPAQAGYQLPPVSGGFGYGEARVEVQSALLNLELLNHYKAQKEREEASAWSARDARDVVVLAVGTAYFQVVASQARVATAQAALDSARELADQFANQYKSEVSPEIDVLRAEVELHTAEQRLLDASNDLKKDKLTLDRITGIPLDQPWSPAGTYVSDSLPKDDVAAEGAPVERPDIVSARREVTAAELDVKSERAQRIPSISLNASYGGGGTNPGNFNQVYEVTGTVSVPLFTSGRIHADVQKAQADLVRRRAELSDLEGRADYDVRTARLDAETSQSAVKVAQQNKDLAQRALLQSQDRYSNGVTNYLEVLQAQEAMVSANENYIASLFSFNVAKLSLARALGSSETRLPALFSRQ